MSTEENKAIVRQLVDEVQNQGKFEVVDDLVAPSFVNHSAPPGVPADREGVKQVMMAFRIAFPDGHMTIEEMIAEADKVVTRKTFHGTHEGPFMGVPPAGKQVRLGLIDILRLEDGRVVEHWLEADMLGLLQQLGAIPTSAE